MWNYWLKIDYSSSGSIPTWKQWAKMSDELRYDNKSSYIIDLNTIKAIDILTEENKKHVLGTLTGGSIGLIALGPLGAIGGMLIGGNKKEVNIAVTLNDGRNFVARCTTKTYASLIPYKERNKENAAPSQDSKECPMCAELVKTKAKICRFCNHKFE